MNMCNLFYKSIQMKKILSAILMACCLGLPGAVRAQSEWVPPTVPGVDLSGTVDASQIVYMYNVAADAFVTYGMNWGTKAVAVRLYGGDKAAHDRMRTTITKNADGTVRLINKDKGKNIGGNPANVNDVWADFSTTNHYSFSEVSSGSKTYTLAYDGSTLGLTWQYGGPLSLKDAIHTEWAFIPATSITDGSYKLYKARKELYAVYEACVAAGFGEYFADVLEASHAVYASTDAAAVLAEAGTLLTKVHRAIPAEATLPANALFTNADMSGAATASDWGGGTFSYGCFERYQTSFTLTQTRTVPNGKYSVDFHAFYRNDGSTAAPKLTVTGAEAKEANVPCISDVDFGSVAGGDNWSNNKPNGQYSAASALGHTALVATVTDVPVSAGSLTIKASETGSKNWVVWQRFDISYRGMTNAELLADYPNARAQVEAWAQKKMSAALKQKFQDALDAAPASLNESSSRLQIVTAADGLTSVIVEHSAAANSCVAAYEYLARELATATSVGADVATYQAGYDNGTYDEAGANAAAQDVNVATFNHVKNAYKYDYAIGKWTGSSIESKSEQNWDGTATTMYYDTWGSNINRSLTNTVTLPAGKYVLQAAGRLSTEPTTSMVLDIDGAQMLFKARGGEGYGIDVSGAANFSADGTYANNGAGRGWEWQHLYLDLAEAKTLTLKATIKTGDAAGWGSFTDIKLWMDKETFETLYYSQLAEKLEACKPWVNKGEYATTTYPSYQEAYNNKTYTTKEEIEQAMADLQAAYDAYVPFAEAYDYLARELATAASVGAVVTEQQAGYDAGTYDEAGAIAAAQAVNVATYNKVKDTYLYEYEVTGWTGELGTASGQHWSGDGRSYYDSYGSNLNLSHSKTLTLPAGDYVLRAAGRSSAIASMYLDIEGTRVPFRGKGDLGFGIDTNGDANFSADGTYANGGAGRGWEWQHLRLTLTEETTLTLKATLTTGATASWGSFSDIALFMDEATYVSLRYPEFGALLEACKPVEGTSTYATSTYPEYQAAYEGKTYTTMAALETAMADLQTAYNAYRLEMASPEHPYDITAQVIKNADCTANDNWPGSGRSMMNGEHWSGDAGRQYFAQNHEDGAARSQAITLPYTGLYLLKSSVRACVDGGYAEIGINLPNDTERSTTVLGRTGGTIATDGTEWVSVAEGIAAGKTFANNNNGRGWYYNNLYFAVLDDTQMSRTITINLSNYSSAKREANCGGMTLYYLGNSSIEREVGNTTRYYGFYETAPAIELTDATPIADLRRASLTGATVTGTNPNGLVFANSTDAVSTTNNVVVNGTCANLSLTDGHAFVTPEAFTATAATYTLPAVATAAGKSFGTLCLPFEVTAVAGTTYALDKGVTANDELYGTEVTTIPAGTPVLVTAAGTYTGAGQVAATTAGATFRSGELVGTYEGCTAPVSSYVLQKHDDRVAFYLVGADVQPTVKPFRAYIAPQANGVRMLDIALDGELTGIESAATTGTATITACYDAQGRRIAAPRRGLNILHMSDGTIQKVIIK